MPKPLVVSADQAPAPLKMVGEEVIVLASGAQTGSYEIFRQAGPEGSGPPPHSHAWDEAFYVIDGEVMFGVDAEQDLVAKGGHARARPRWFDALVPVRPGRWRDDLDDVARRAHRRSSPRSIARSRRPTPTSAR